MKKLFFLFAALCCMAAASAQTEVNQLIAELKNPNAKNVIVVSHRGDWRGAPENSLQAFKNCIDMGVDMVELDLKKTKDNQLVIMHDATLDRTTTGHGPTTDYTLAEIKKLRLRNACGIPTAHTVPTLEEVLNLCKGKILINVDQGYDFFKDAYALMEKTGTTAQIVIKSGYPLAKVQSENGDVLKRVVYMPIVNLNSDDAEKFINDYAAIRPVAIECCFGEVTPKVLQLLKLVRKNGSKVWINSLWPSLNGGHDDDRAVELGEKDAAWGWILQQGAQLIQTDRPAALIEYLYEKGRHKMPVRFTVKRTAKK